MKRIIFALMLFAAGNLYSQQQYQIYRVRSGPYNNYTREFNTQENRVNMAMVLDKSVIRVYDDARSVYITRNHELLRDDQEGVLSKWDGVDEQGRNVGIYMLLNKQTGESSITVMYNDFLFQYFFHE